MSRTEIYRLGRDPDEIGSTKNSWRGAMYVWNDIAKRYFGWDSFPWDPAGQSKVWNAQKHAKLSEHEILVLQTTMDNATVRGKDVDRIATAFERYAEDHPNSSLLEQAQILRTADVQPDDLIAWNQTSVSEFWGRGWDEEKDEPIWYDPTTGSKHFDVCEFTPPAPGGAG